MIKTDVRILTSAVPAIIHAMPGFIEELLLSASGQP
jgi:hypothetical protein